MSCARPALNVDNFSYSSSAAMSHSYSGYSTPTTSSFASSSTMTTPSRSSRNGSTSPTSLRHTGAYRRSGSLGLSASTYAAVVPPPEEDLSTDQVKDKSKALLELVSSGQLSLEAVLAFPLDWTKVFDQQQQQATQASNNSTISTNQSSATTREDAPPCRKKQRRPASLPIAEASTSSSSAPSSAIPIVSPTFSDVSSISAPARPFSPLGSSSLSSSRDESVDPLCTPDTIAPHRKLTIIERRRIAKQTRLRLAAAAARAASASNAGAGYEQSSTDSMWLHSWSYSWATPAATTATTTMIGSPQQTQFSSKGLDGTDADGDAIPDLVIELPKLSFSAAAMRAAPARPAVPDHWQPARHQVPTAVAPL